MKIKEKLKKNNNNYLNKQTLMLKINILLKKNKRKN